MPALTTARALPDTARSCRHVWTGHHGSLGQMSHIPGVTRLAGTMSVALTTVALERGSRLVELIESISANSQVRSCAAALAPDREHHHVRLVVCHWSPHVCPAGRKT